MASMFIVFCVSSKKRYGTNTSWTFAITERLRNEYVYSNDYNPICYCKTSTVYMLRPKLSRESYFPTQHFETHVPKWDKWDAQGFPHRQRSSFRVTGASGWEKDQKEQALIRGPACISHTQAIQDWHGSRELTDFVCPEQNCLGMF